MIVKTLSGIQILDESLGGVFSNRSFLVTGASGAGKTVFGLQFTRQGLEQNERCLYLSTMAANDLGICAEALGFSLAGHVEENNLILLEYESFIPGNRAPGQDMLPPEGFDQLREIIHANSVERVVLDTVLPWVAVKQPDRMSEQIFSFVRSFDRLGVTTLMTLPKPVSSMAFRLKKSLEDVVPVSILLQPPGEGEPGSFQVVKYLGEKRLGGKTPIVIDEHGGIRELKEGETVPESVETETPLQERPVSEAPHAGRRVRPSFTAATLDAPRPARRAEPARTPPAPEPEAEPGLSSHPARPAGDSDLPRGSGFSRPDATTALPPKEPEDAAPRAARLSSIWTPKQHQDDGGRDD